MPDRDGYPTIDEMELGEIFAALADPHRRQVVFALAREPQGGERSCSSFDLPVTKATRTHHFRVLREAGLIRQRDIGNGRMNKLRREELNRRFPGLLELLLAEKD
ncbi:MAG: helix-turn-helix domain-containing protein [Rhodopseudomonas sp.]|nr:helix-turn-helix domain-containing protein [Rhodopseudomonas sp.]